jgi:hypothetical protein
VGVSSRGLVEVEVVGYGEVNSVLGCLACDSSVKDSDERRDKHAGSYRRVLLI